MQNRWIDAIFMHINQPRSYVRNPHLGLSFERAYTDYYFVFLISMSRRSADKVNLPQCKHKLTGFNPEWGRDFPFVLYTEDTSGAGGMFCAAVLLLR